MIYNTFEPYNEDNNNQLNDIKYNNSFNYNECFICMENSTDGELIQLKNINNYIKNYTKNCKCNSLIHLKCLNNWIDIKSVCPICRIKLIEINIININNNHNNNSHTLHMITQNINRNLIYTGISKVLFITIWVIIIIYIFVISFKVDEKVIDTYKPKNNDTIYINNSYIGDKMIYLNNSLFLDDIFNRSKYYN